MNFQDFSKYLAKIESTSSRNDMTAILVDLLKKLPKNSIKEAMYLMQGRVVPRFIPLEFNVARRLMARAIADAFKLSDNEVNSQFAKLGDLGLVVEEYSNIKDSDIQIIQIFKSLFEIASASGKDSQTIKIKGISALISKCDKLSCRFMVRMILGNLRLGFSDKSILDALSIYSTGDKSKRELLDQAYGVRNDIGDIAEIVLGKGISAVEKIKIEVGVPISSMLCEREESLEKILARMASAVLQPKYDGIRCQVHFSKDGFDDEFNSKAEQNMILKKEKVTVRLFSRNLESLTEMFPDVAEAIKKLKIDSAVFDGEIIGFDDKTGKFLQFQETIQRRRKYEIKKKVKDIPIRIYLFDLLYLNGKELIQQEYSERLEELKELLSTNRSEVLFFTPSTEIKGKLAKNEAQAVYEKYVGEGLEGIVAKSSSSKYMPGKRGFDWIKFKRSAKGLVVDTVDAVVLGYYKGRGARAKFGIGAFLIGVLNDKKERFESIAKVGTGVKDEQWGIIRKRLDKIIVKEKPGNVEVAKVLDPDVWVRPEVTVVVEADEITKSPSHMAGFKDGMGYSLRFPRLKVFDRKDKSAEQITTVAEVEELLKLGSRKVGR